MQLPCGVLALASVFALFCAGAMSAAAPPEWEGGRSAPGATSAREGSAPRSSDPQASGATAGLVLDGPPQSPDPHSRHVVYLHGAILETEGPEAVHPRFGAYEYAAILDSLAAAGLVVMSELRGPGTDGEAYAETVAVWVDSLLSSGIPPEYVTVVGFSKGGGIAMRACELISNERLNYVFMACCPRGMVDWPHRGYAGRILSVYESSDTFAGSCRGAVLGDGALAEADRRRDAAPPRVDYQELQIHTGLAHGAFYRPILEWLDPVVEWAHTAETE